ncbi:MAG: choice-of-anchor tandem repeat GloVer-containing protein [Rhizomicrobium sp.]
MRNRHTLYLGALLGSALALAALTPAAAASASRADLKRILAATGRPASAVPQKSGAVSGFAAVRQPSTYTVLHDFAGGTNDGQDSTAEVTLDASGNIYGTTAGGGANSMGTLFELAPGGTETLLHSFGATGDGELPDGAVTVESNGDMYGTTNYGGASDNGTIWERQADGTYSVLHSFAYDEGNLVRGRLVQDGRGNFYGTALFGGAPGDGTVFKYSAKGKLTVLHAFNGTDGEFPEHGVVRDKAGNLYGVTAFGGSSGDGTVYEIAADETFTTLYNFTGGADGGFLYGGLAIDRSGNLYGSTVDDGADSNGTVFKLAPDGTLTTLYSFTGGTDGGGAEGDMLRVGKKLYSTATSGGANGDGGVYEVTLRGKEKMLHAYTGSDGSGYSAGVTKSGRSFYGTVSGGGTDGDGVVFSLTK